MNGPRLRIRTPSRLHFGLLAWNPRATRQFGGVGLMVEAPGLELTAEAAPGWIFEGPLADRIERVVGLLCQNFRESGIAVPSARIRMERAPTEHVGLGLGTQLSLAVARALLNLAGLAEPTLERLARLTERGARSGIGLHGFLHGGLIVDGGRTDSTGIPPLLARVPFPPAWSILIVQPPGPSGLHGPEERDAFASLPSIPQEVTDSLCRIVFLEILPAVIERELSAFGSALTELQARVGACFAPAQGGTFAAPLAAEIVCELRNLGFVGVGQSSWGPTLYAFDEISEHELNDRAEVVRRAFNLPGPAVFATRAANSGAVLLEES
jgi:beta-ribofuranosylaminobenzene 5'-phosphate synthase